MLESNMSFSVNGNAVVCNMLDGEIKARMSSRKDPAKRKMYREKGIIDSSSSITKFMVKHSNFLGNPKLIHPDGSNFFGSIIPLSHLSDKPEYKERLKSRMMVEYELTDEELQGVDRFLHDLTKLDASPDIQAIVDDTKGYKASIELAWKENEQNIMTHIYNTLGYVPQNMGKVNTYIMYPSFDTHRSCQQTQNNTSLFFGKRKESDPNKIISYLAHQAIHQPALPYKPTMTKKQKERFHAFIKFLADKDVYYYLTGKSYLDIVTQDENAEAMSEVYPFWLGYRYRNLDKEGRDPVVAIRKAIQRDKEYFDSLPENSKKRKLYAGYAFEKLDPEKIANIFRERKAMTPYQFAELEFDNKALVYKNRYVSRNDDEIEK